MNAVLSYLEASDQRIATRVADWRTPRWLRRWMIAMSRLGDGWLWLPCIAWLAAHEASGLERAASLAVIVNAAIIILKRLTRRSRPANGGAPPIYDRYSFPSGHAMNAFAACGAVALAEPVLALLALALAGNIAVARVVLGRHYASDVIAGGALGIFAAAFVRLL